MSKCKQCGIFFGGLRSKERHGHEGTGLCHPCWRKGLYPAPPAEDPAPGAAAGCPDCANHKIGLSRRHWLEQQKIGLEEENAALRAEVARLREAADAGARFKGFCHSYLTEHGVPEGDPTNQHQKEGCRIGARLDLLLGDRDRWREGLQQAEGREAALRRTASTVAEAMDRWLRTWTIETAHYRDGIKNAQDALEAALRLAEEKESVG